MYVKFFSIVCRQSLNEVTTKLEQQEQLLADNEKTGISNVMYFVYGISKSIYYI